MENNVRRGVSDVITSVLGFNFTCNLQVKDENGNVKVLTGGVKSSVHPASIEGRVEIGKSHLNTSFFTNFDSKLLEKIKDYQKRNF